MRKLFYTAATAAALALSSTAANAALVLSPVAAPGPTIVVPASGTFGNSFGNAGDTRPATPGTFTDVFNFTLSAGAVGNAFLGSIALNAGNNIDFTCPTCSILFDNTPFIQGTAVINGQNTDTFTLNPLNVTSGLHRITVNGNIVSGPTASYSGTFNFAAVPEPATWALMLLGFFGVGIAVRRTRRPVLAQLA